MNGLTLRRKFMVGMVTVLIVSIVILFGNRLLGKAALFHYLEREHLENVLLLDKSLTLAEQAAKNASALRREDVLAYIDKATAIAARADVETFFYEKALFRLLGFGGLLDLPKKDIGDLDRMRAAIVAAPGTGVTEEMAVKLKADKETVLDNSQKFTVLVLEATSFIKTTVTTLALIAVMALGATLFFLYRSTLAPIDRAIQVAQRIAGGDLSQRIEAQSNDEFGLMFKALREMNDNLARIVDHVRSGAESMTTVTNEIAAGNADLSARTESQAGSIEETAASMEELTTTVRQNAENAQQANQLAISASEFAVKGGTVVESVVQTMGQIRESSNKIADIISVIDGIAFQTNILALNAAVEAARAGEQGRGFAVVAAEVRTLAQRSAGAAKEIKQLINASVETVEAGGKLVDDAGHTMSDIVTSIQRVAGIVNEISNASREQSAGIGQINEAISSVDHATQQNAALVEQAAAAADSLKTQAEELARTVAVFKLDNGGAVRSANRLPA